MTTTPISAAAKAPTPPARPSFTPGPIRTTVANTLRGLGEGLNVGSDVVGVAWDTASLRPTEALLGTGLTLKTVANRTDNSVVKKVAGGAGKATGLIGFGAAFWSLIWGSMLRAPGDVARNLTQGAADVIEGSRTL